VAQTILYGIFKTIKLIEIKANKQPIGKTDLVQPFTTHDIEYKEDTTFFLFTDGLADQFGGPKGKKFKYKQFQELLISINDKSMPEQSLHIDKEFENWRKDLEQVDDVCVIGIKI
jgi:serine phosphatase RsbU (regulator of sigma subunit)